MHYDLEDEDRNSQQDDNILDGAAKKKTEFYLMPIEKVQSLWNCCCCTALKSLGFITVLPIFL